MPIENDRREKRDQVAKTKIEPERTRIERRVLYQDDRAFWYGNWGKKRNKKESLAKIKLEPEYR